MPLEDIRIVYQNEEHNCKGSEGNLGDRGERRGREIERMRERAKDKECMCDLRLKRDDRVRMELNL
jgi:hypothetical protein